jgi:UDP-glucose 4-epimerase
VGRRLLITGLASFWGGRMAQALERSPGIDVIVGLDTGDPSVELERTEFVRSDESYSILARLVRATQVDTVVHAGLVVDSTRMADRRIHENNVIGTMNLLAAAGASDSSVRSVVVKSSSLVYGSSQQDPYWFREHDRRPQPARTRVERALLEVESYLRAFAEDHADRRVAVLRFGNVLGPNIVTPLSKALSLPFVPRIAGFDPQMQFIEEHDVVRALAFAVEHELDGVYNVAGPGRLPWSEVLALAGRQALPLPPVLSSLAAAPLARLRVFDLPPEVLDLLRYGRGIDITKIRRAGFTFRHTTASAVAAFAEAQRLRQTVGAVEPTYRYQVDVETFFRRSPAIVHPG